MTTRKKKANISYKEIEDSELNELLALEQDGFQESHQLKPTRKRPLSPPRKKTKTAKKKLATAGAPANKKKLKAKEESSPSGLSMKDLEKHPFDVPDVMRCVMLYLDNARDIYQLSKTTKSIRSSITTQIVVRSAAFSHGKTHESMSSIASLLKTQSIPVPKPLRLLQLVNGRQCEMGSDCRKWNPRTQRAALLSKQQQRPLRNGRHVCQTCSQFHRGRLEKERKAFLTAEILISRQYQNDRTELLECYDQVKSQEVEPFWKAKADLQDYKKQQKILLKLQAQQTIITRIRVELEGSPHQDAILNSYVRRDGDYHFFGPSMSMFNKLLQAPSQVTHAKLDKAVDQVKQLYSLLDKHGFLNGKAVMYLEEEPTEEWESIVFGYYRKDLDVTQLVRSSALETNLWTSKFVKLTFQLLSESKVVELLVALLEQSGLLVEAIETYLMETEQHTINAAAVGLARSFLHERIDRSKLGRMENLSQYWKTFRILRPIYEDAYLKDPKVVWWLASKAGPKPAPNFSKEEALQQFDRITLNLLVKKEFSRLLEYQKLEYEKWCVQYWNDQQETKRQARANPRRGMYGHLATTSAHHRRRRGGP